MELGVELAVAASQHLELRHAGLIVGVQQQLGISRGRGVARHEGQAALCLSRRSLQAFMAGCSR